MANLQANLRSQFALAREQPQSFPAVGQPVVLREHGGQRVRHGLLCRVRRRLRGGCATRIAGIFPAFCCAVMALVEWLHSTGHGVWVSSRSGQSPTVECQLASGDTLALYTDGVTESFNAAGEEFGEHRLLEAMKRHREQPAQRIVSSVDRGCPDFQPAGAARRHHADRREVPRQCMRNDGSGGAGFAVTSSARQRGWRATARAAA